MRTVLISPSLQEKAQELRARVYAADGVTISPDTANHWHIVVTDLAGEPIGAARMQVFQNPKFEDLALSISVPHAREQVTAQLQKATRRGLLVSELGGFVVSPEVRGAMVGKRIVTEIYRLSEELGGCLGLATATTRHRSAALLRRLGGEPLVEPYFDAEYGCEMELLRFITTSKPT